MKKPLSKREKPMRISVKNAGIIKNAEIKLDGITVIAGKNGTGKTAILYWQDPLSSGQ